MDALQAQIHDMQKGVSALESPKEPPGPGSCAFGLSSHLPGTPSLQTSEHPDADDALSTMESATDLSPTLERDELLKARSVRSMPQEDEEKCLGIRKDVLQ